MRYITLWRKNVLDHDYYVSETLNEAKQVVYNLSHYHNDAKDIATYQLGEKVDI